MASKADRRRQRRREKGNSKRKVRQQAARVKRRQSKVRSTGALSGLPLGECFAGENWPEQGETVWAAVSRRHKNGKIAAAIYQVDLAEPAVLSAELIPELTPEQLHGELGRRAGEQVVAVCEPELVAGLVYAARPDAGQAEDEALQLLLSLIHI